MNKICMTILLMFASIGVWAAGDPVPHVFSNGAPADANQVNENFQDLADRISEISTSSQGPAGPQGEQGPPGTGLATYNYLDYSHNFSAKTFEYSIDGVLKYTDTRTYDRSTPGTLVVHRHRISNSNPATEDFSSTTYSVDEDGLRLSQILAYDTFDINNPGANDPIAIQEYSPPILLRKTSMMMGVTWGFFTTTTRTDYNTQPAEVTESYFSRKFILLGLESVTARGATYDNCIRIHVSTDITLSSNFSKSVQWYCEGFGLVKTVSARPTQTFNGGITSFIMEISVLELVSTTP